MTTTISKSGSLDSLNTVRIVATDTRIYFKLFARVLQLSLESFLFEILKTFRLYSRVLLIAAHKYPLHSTTLVPADTYSRCSPGLMAAHKCSVRSLILFSVKKYEIYSILIGNSGSLLTPETLSKTGYSSQIAKTLTRSGGSSQIAKTLNRSDCSLQNAQALTSSGCSSQIAKTLTRSGCSSQTRRSLALVAAHK